MRSLFIVFFQSHPRFEYGLVDEQVTVLIMAIKTIEPGTPLHVNYHWTSGGRRGFMSTIIGLLVGGGASCQLSLDFWWEEGLDLQLVDLIRY